MFDEVFIGELSFRRGKPSICLGDMCTEYFVVEMIKLDMLLNHALAARD